MIDQPQAFRDYLRARNVAPSSVEVYARMLRRVDGTEQPDPAQVVTWIREHISDHTPKGTFLSVRAGVTHYLSFSGFVLPDPPLLPKVRRLPAKFKDALDEAEYVDWVQIVRESDLPPQSRAILALLPVTAMRIAEACSLRWEFYQPTNDSSGNPLSAKITIVGKGRKQAVLSLGVDAACVLHELYALDDHPARGWVFPSPIKPGSSLTPNAVRYHVRRLSEASHIAKRISPHILRHTAATRLLRSGASLPLVQAVLRHADIKTTTGYLHPTDADIARAFDLIGDSRTTTED